MGNLHAAATSYPGTLDTASTLVDDTVAGDGSGTEIIAAHQNGPAGAIIAIETELGVNPAGSLTDLVTRLNVTQAADGAYIISGGDITADSIPFGAAAGALSQDATNLVWDSANNRLQLAAQGSSGGIIFGTDVVLYRNAANTMLMNSSFEITGTGASSIGGAAIDRYRLTLTGNYTSVGTADAALVAVLSSITGASGDTNDVNHMKIAGAITTQAASEAITVCSTLYLAEPAITIGTATVTNSATLYIAGAATEATNDYGIWVDGGNVQIDDDLAVSGNSSMTPRGSILLFSGTAAPSGGWLLCDGVAVTQSNALLLVVLIPSAAQYGTGSAVGTVTVANGTDIWTSAGHGLSNGDVVHLTTSAGDLPNGSAIDTVYYIIGADTNTFQLSTTSGGSALDVSDNGTGTHTLHDEVNVPDLRGRFPLGQDDMGQGSANRVTHAQADLLGGSEGAETHVISTAELPAHDHGSAGAHTHDADFEDTGSTGSNALGGSGSAENNTRSDAIDSSGAHTHTSVGSGTAHENMSPYLTINYIIKT